MSTKKIGNENTYVEYNPIMSFGAKMKYQKLVFSGVELVETKDGKTTKFLQLPFIDTPEGFLLTSQITKIFENGKVLAEGKAINADVIYNDIDNSQNFDKVIEDVRKENNLGLEKQDDEIKK